MPTAIEHGSAGPEASGNAMVHNPKPKLGPPCGCLHPLVAPTVGIAERVTGQPSGAKLDPSGEVVGTQPGWPCRATGGGVPEVMSFPLDDGRAGP